MYLSKLEIFGFKSFAQKVNLSFDIGMTAIVGPNGCGKTNVVDALRWALGEQKPTTLRSDKMEDVIFNGTKSRKPLGVAEVSITIENTKGILPTEYTEVTITRRVFRSGESEYYLNQALCRLKDIRDLFMDTGMGSDAYSVIELKMVESILSDNSDERRRLFEESAGVTKYKHRRKEAVRRLESVRGDLTRVNDILRGVEKAVNSLERQAQKAEKFNEFNVKLKELEMDLIAREYSSVVDKISPLQEQLSVAVTEKNKIEVELQQEEALLDVLRTELRELEQQLEQAQESMNERQNILHQLEQSQATSEERKKSLASTIVKYEAEKQDLVLQQGELIRKEAELRTSLAALGEQVQAAEERAREKAAVLTEIERQLDTKKAEAKSAQERVIELLHQLNDVRSRESEAKARTENIRGRLSYTSEENQIYQKEIEANEELVTKLTQENKLLRVKFAEAEVRTHQMEEYKEKLQSTIDELRHRALDVRGDLERKQGRIDFLKGLVESFDGYSEGAKFLITSDEWQSQIQTTVGDLVKTKPELRVAIETALGEATGFVVVENIRQAYAAMEFLKKNQKGKATFICLDRLPEVQNHRHTLNSEGVVGWANGLVEFDSKYSKLFNFLLDETVLVNDVHAATMLVSKEQNLRCVTLDGEMISDKGLMRGGSSRQDEGGHIGKKNQLDELLRDVDALKERTEAVQRELRAKVEELESVNLKKLTEEARSIEQEKVSVEVRIAQLEFEKKRAHDNMERNSSEAAKLSDEIGTLAAELNELTPRLHEREGQKAEAERHVGVAASELETIEALWNESSRLANEANVKVLSLKSEEKNILQSIDHAHETLASTEAAVKQREQDVLAARNEIAEISTNVEQMQLDLFDVKKDLNVVVEQRKSVDKEHVAKRAQAHEIELKLKDERSRQEGSLKAAHDLEFKIQELTMKSENLKVRAKEKFEVDLVAQQFADAESFDLNAAREQVRELSEKIRGLGAVNFAAFDEYKSEKERLDFMTAQRDDLLESEKTILQTIDEINTTAQNQFMGIFEQIRENFITTFKSLFDEGDECDLRLEEGVDPLEARIEIVAKPRGKRPTSIDLLSGGEKTLTAIALLFAIYLVKPSPFCILDEVDAPLDDTNIDRFTRIIKKFSNNTQFVIVTHNKRTMEAANAMYGVTMEEEGISKLVSVKFGEAVKS